MFACLSICECANFQSSLDGKSMDMSSVLVKVSHTVFCHSPGKSNHIQLYTDSPHRHQSQAYKYPVSGLVVTCGLGHPQTQGAMHSRAAEYVQHMKELELKFFIKLVLRIKRVSVFSKGQEMPTYLQAS